MEESRSSVRFVGAHDVVRGLASAIAACKAGDPTVEVWVAVANSVVSQNLRTAPPLATSFNVHFLTNDQLAERLADREALPPHRLTREIRREIARLVGRDARPPLEDLTPSALTRSLTRSFHNLRDRSDPEIDRIAESSALAAEIVRLFRAFRALVKGRFADPRDVFASAASNLRHSCPNVVALVAEPPNAHQTTLLQALSRIERLQVVALQTGDESLDAELRPWLWGLGATSDESTGTADTTARVIVAPDPMTEIDIAITELLTEAERGTPFSRMALLYGNQSPYAGIVHDRLRAAGVPCSGGPIAPLLQSVVGRFVNAYLRFLEEGISQSTMSDWLSCGPLLEPESREPVPASEWLRLARKAHLGNTSWAGRLHTYAENDSSNDAAATKKLARFVQSLYDLTSETHDTWSGWADNLQKAIDAYLGDANSRDTWPRQEQVAAIQLDDLLIRLRSLDAIALDIDAATFCTVVADECLAITTGSSNKRGVFTGTPGDALGAVFDVTVLCGMSEGVFPAALQDDALLAALRVPGEQLHSQEQRRAFMNVITSSGRKTLTCARSDRRNQRERQPSPWLVEYASLRSGHLLTAGNLLQPDESRPWLEIVPSFQAALSRSDIQSTAQLTELAQRSRHHRNAAANASGSDSVLETYSSIQAGLVEPAIRMLSDRESDELTAFDGAVGENTALQIKEALTATTLERWATCPFRYFLKSVLNVPEPDDNDDLFTTPARQRGAVVHHVLETFIKEAKPRTSPDDPWTSSERDRLHEIADEKLHESWQKESSPAELLKEVESKKLHVHLDRLLDEDQRVRASIGVVPKYVELSFGPGSRASGSVCDGGHQRVAFRGRIDRIDVSPDGTRVDVIDYKTGRAARAPSVDGDPVAAGSRLQLAIYGEAAKSLYPESQITACYWYITDDAGPKQQRIDIDKTSHDRLSEVIGHMRAGIESGVFPAVPAEDDGRSSFKNCRSCPYDSVCPVDRDELWARKASDPKAAHFHALAIRT